MRRLAQAPDIALATLWADTLRESGIECHVQRQFLGGAVGELPPDQCLPELWIVHDEQEAAARTLLQELRDIPQQRWRCSCGEAIEGGFGSCWQCGRMMPPG